MYILLYGCRGDGIAWGVVRLAGSSGQLPVEDSISHQSFFWVVELVVSHSCHRIFREGKGKVRTNYSKIILY